MDWTRDRTINVNFDGDINAKSLEIGGHDGDEVHHHEQRGTRRRATGIFCEDKKSLRVKNANTCFSTVYTYDRMFKMAKTVHRSLLKSTKMGADFLA